jgi:phospholipid/cholesterol/gamma-HCH transport system substrate-binding protein
METRANYVAVGGFVLAMVVLAFGAVLWLVRGELTTQYSFYDIYFQGPVTGLREGASVDYNGVPIGTVKDVRIDPDNVALIRVTIQIDPKVAIKTDAAASVETNLLSGVSYIQIVGGTQDAPLLRPEGNQRYAVIRSRRSRLASVTVRAPQLLEKLIDTAERVNDLLDDKNRRAFGESIENFRVFTSGLVDRNNDLAEITGHVNTAARTLSNLLENVDQSYAGPDGIGKQLSTAITDFDKVARSLNDTNRQLQLALQDVRPGLRTFSQQTLGDVGNLVAEARQLLNGLSRLASGIERDPSSVLFGDRREGYRPK